MIDYFLILLISVLGLPAGVFLAWVAHKEISDYRKIFLASRDLTSIAAVFTIFISSPSTLSFLLSALLSVLSIYFLRRNIKYAFAILSAPFILSYNTQLFPYAASIIFLHGAIIVSLMHEKKKPKFNVASILSALDIGTYFLASAMLLGFLTIFL